MNNLESAIHWRQWSVAIILALLIALFSLNQFNLLRLTGVILSGSVVLLLSLGWNIHAMRLAHSQSNMGWNSEIADGLLITGMILVFFGAFF